MPELVLYVSQEDIANGKLDDCFECAAARSALRRFGPEYRVEVLTKYLWVYPVNETLPLLAFSAQEDAENFIRRFDRGEPMTPQFIHYVPYPLN